MKTVVGAILLAASLTGMPAVTAHADPVPSPDDVVAIMAKLTDPDTSAANKTDIVTPGFSPEVAGTVDDHLNRMRHRSLPLNFVVSDIQPAANGTAGATLSTEGFTRQHTAAKPIVLVDQGGHWLITHDSAMAELDVFWRAANRRLVVIP
jgi:hypothetical protein